ncbi:MAG: hypothetical protein KGN01_07905 [Patescibacteria group bacterium]|nr:hypothetical protein [Patescibacteria group bacterium]
MTTINTAFKIGSYNIAAEASFNGRTLNTVISVDGTEVERASSNAADYYTASFLSGAALEAYDQKWLKDYATDAVMSALLCLIEERAA